MRKILPLGMLLLVCVLSAEAQKKSSSNTTIIDPKAKIDAQLLNAVKSNLDLQMDKSNASAIVNALVLVDITGKITPELKESITAAGGQIISIASANDNITIKVPVASLEKIASSDDVKYIKKSAVVFNINGSKKPLSNAGSLNTVLPVSSGKQRIMN